MTLLNNREFNEFLIKRDLKLRQRRNYVLFLFLLYNTKIWFTNTIKKIGYLLLVVLFIFTLGAFVSLLYVVFSGQLLRLFVNSEDISQWGNLLREDWKYISNIFGYFLVCGILFGITVIVIPKQIKKLWWKIFPTEEDIQEEKKAEKQQMELDKNMRITDFQDLIILPNDDTQ